MTVTLKSSIVRHGTCLTGTLSVPGDKSISHRVAMLSAIAKGTSHIKNFLASEDCISTLNVLSALGARVFRAEGASNVKIEGTGGKLIEPAGMLNVGNSGTTIRLLSGLVAARPITAVLAGDESLNKRPMGRIREPLERMGARVELTGEKGTPPIRVKGGGLKGIEYTLPVASAQVKSCILLASLYADGTTTVIEPAPTRDHTERLFAAMGIDVDVDGPVVRVQGYGETGPQLQARTWSVPGDISSASFHLLAAAAGEGSDVTIEGVCLNPRRTAFLDVLRRMGADITIELDDDSEQAEPCGTVRVKGARLRGTEVGGAEIPNLIDELPLVAAAGALAEGTTVIRDAAELRVKESDRIATMTANLKALGVDVEEQPDGMVVRGPAHLHAPENGVRSYGDHRIAMAMAVLGLFTPGGLCINNVGCVDTSYPSFWSDLERLGAHVES